MWKICGKYRMHLPDDGLWVSAGALSRKVRTVERLESPLVSSKASSCSPHSPDKVKGRTGRVERRGSPGSCERWMCDGCMYVSGFELHPFASSPLERPKRGKLGRKLWLNFCLYCIFTYPVLLSVLFPFYFYTVWLICTFEKSLIFGMRETNHIYKNNDENIGEALNTWIVFWVPMYSKCPGFILELAVFSLSHGFLPLLVHLLAGISFCCCVWRICWRLS